MVDDCSKLWRDCLHLNKTHDDVENCQMHPAYCAHESDEWMSHFGLDGPDCANLTLSNFPTYLFDIYSWGQSEDQTDEMSERWFICDCNHPFVGLGVTFPDCKNKIENVFYTINNMTKYEKCLTVNGNKNVDAAEICEHLIEEVGLKFGSIFAIFLSIAGLASLALFIYYRRKSAGGRSGYHLRSQQTDTTRVTGDTLPDTRDLLLPSRNVCYDGCVETNAIPRIRQKFSARHPSLKSASLMVKDSV